MTESPTQEQQLQLAREAIVQLDPHRSRLAAVGLDLGCNKIDLPEALASFSNIGDEVVALGLKLGGACQANTVAD